MKSCANPLPTMGPGLHQRDFVDASKTSSKADSDGFSSGSGHQRSGSASSRQRLVGTSCVSKVSKIERESSDVPRPLYNVKKHYELEG